MIMSELASNDGCAHMQMPFLVRCALGFLDGIPTDGWLQKLPKLEKIVNKVASTPSIKAYYAAKVASNKVFTPHASAN